MVRLLKTAALVATAHAFAPLQRIARHIHTSKPWAGALSVSDGGGEEMWLPPDAVDKTDANAIFANGGKLAFADATFDAVVLYRNMFGASLTPECLVQFKVFDYDTHDPNDLIGIATLPLAPTDGPVTLELEHHNCHLCKRPAEIDVERSEQT